MSSKHLTAHTCYLLLATHYRIQEAMASGTFDDLPGRGKPLRTLTSTLVLTPTPTLTLAPTLTLTLTLTLTRQAAELRGECLGEYGGGGDGAPYTEERWLYARV